MTTPKVIPTLDDTPKEPRIKPKRCPRCGNANRPEASTCTTCKFDFGGPPPPPGTIKGPKVASSGGGGAKVALIVFVILLLAAGGGAIAYLGLDQALALAQSVFYKPAPAAPLSPKAAAEASARDAQRKTIASVKADAGLCFSQFNDLMESGKRPVDPNAVLQSYVNNGRQLTNVTTLSAGCGADTKVAPDAQKTDLCDAAAQLKTCLTTVMGMQHERLQSAGYRVNGSALEKISPLPAR